MPSQLLIAPNSGLCARASANRTSYSGHATAVSLTKRLPITPQGPAASILGSPGPSPPAGNRHHPNSPYPQRPALSAGDFQDTWPVPSRLSTACHDHREITRGNHLASLCCSDHHQTPLQLTSAGWEGNKLPTIHTKFNTCSTITISSHLPSVGPIGVTHHWLRVERNVLETARCCPTAGCRCDDGYSVTSLQSLGFLGQFDKCLMMRHLPIFLTFWPKPLSVFFFF